MNTNVKAGMSAENSMTASLERLKDSINDLLLKAEAKDYNTQDTKFIREMIKHHEMAVEMSDKEVDKGKESAAIALAKSIRKAQKGEIDQMKKWLKDRDLTEGDDEGGM